MGMKRNFKMSREGESHHEKGQTCWLSFFSLSKEEQCQINWSDSWQGE